MTSPSFGVAHIVALGATTIATVLVLAPFTGDLMVNGRRVDLRAITCPLFLLAGSTDHITPPPQLFAAADAVGTPRADITLRTAQGGHLGLFMGR